MILGVDPAIAECGWALVDGGRLHARGVIKTAQRKGEVGDQQRRLAEIGQQLWPQMHLAHHVAVEAPTGGFGKNAGAAAKVALVAGAVIGMAWGIGRKVIAPASVTWRAKLGHARGKDELLHAELLRRYPELEALTRGDRPHVLDAIGLCLYGEQIANPNRAGEQLAIPGAA